MSVLEYFSSEEILQSRAFWEKAMGKDIDSICAVICVRLERAEEGREAEELVLHIKTLKSVFPQASPRDISCFMVFALFTLQAVADRSISVDEMMKWVTEAHQIIKKETRNVH